MNKEQLNVQVRYILFNGHEIEIDKIDPNKHQFPLDLIEGERKIRAILNVKKRALLNVEPILEIHEDGSIKDNLL